MPYEIDSNVTFSPNKRSGRKSKINEMPFDRIQIGESFHVDQTSKEAANRLSGYCQIAGKRLSKRFAMRTVDASDPRGPGVRIWRVEDKAQSLDALFERHTPAPKAVEPEPTKVVLKSGKRKAPATPEPQPSRRQRRQAEGRSFSAQA